MTSGILYAIYIIMNDNNFPQRLKELRKKLSMSQQDLAVLVGVSWTTVNRWENEVSKPSRLAVRQIERLEAKNNKN